MNATGSEWTPDATRTQGELTLWAALLTELDDETARQAAAGWGADTSVRFESENRTAYVWTVRMDAPGEAGELDAAFETYLTRRTDGSEDDDTAFRLESVSDDTLVLLAGTVSFVDATTVDGRPGNVTVTVAADAGNRTERRDARPDTVTSSALAGVAQ